MLLQKKDCGKSNMNNLLLLASKSQSRQKLLEESKIQFRLIEQNLDESKFDFSLPLQKLVETIATQKMDHDLSASTCACRVRVGASYIPLP